MVEEFSAYICDKIKFLFKQLNTSYKQSKYFINHMSVVMPEKILLSQTLSIKKNSTEAVEEYDELDEENYYGYFIPMEKSVQKLLDTVPDNLKIAEANEGTIKRDYFDAENFKNMNKKNNELAFGLFCDEMEIANGIGPNKKTHKLSKYRNIYF